MKPISKLIVAILLSTAFLVWATSHSDAAFRPAPLIVYNTTYLPSDAKITCAISSQQFNNWFVGKKANAGGIVLPANSVLFPHNNNCDFYRWSEQMFLWLTSPTSKQYGGDGRVLESGLFYDVSPASDSDVRVLMPHSLQRPLQMGAFLKKDGPHRLPVIRDSKGHLYEIEGRWDVEKEQAVVKDAMDNLVPVKRIVSAVNGKYILLDKNEKTISAPKARLKNGSPSHIAQLVGKLGKKHVFLTSEGNYIDSEEGQATGDVLMAQTGSLVYYLTMVNDVYAWYMTGSKSGNISDTTFPTDSAARNRICAFARANGKVLPDSNALAMEIKSSWVEAATLPTAVKNNYITVKASIPVYSKVSFASKTGDSVWVPTGKSKTAVMALIGMHIVGSVAGHPEMVWATFEHNSNSPNAAYNYISQTGKPISVKPENGSNWLLSANLTDNNYNVSHMNTNTIGPNDNFTIDASGDTIRADSGFTISSSNTNRAMPWGTYIDSLSNPQDTTSTASNTEIIAFNHNIRKLLMGKDVRKNYLLIGATWTERGTAPNGKSYGTDKAPGVAIGTSRLANSTMETYFQGDSTTCFFCHSGNNSNNPNYLSHIFTTTKPLGYTAWLQRFKANNNVVTK